MIYFKHITTDWKISWETKKSSLVLTVVKSNGFRNYAWHQPCRGGGGGGGGVFRVRYLISLSLNYQNETEHVLSITGILSLTSQTWVSLTNLYIYIYIHNIYTKDWELRLMSLCSQSFCVFVFTWTQKRLGAKIHVSWKVHWHYDLWHFPYSFFIWTV